MQPGRMTVAVNEYAVCFGMECRVAQAPTYVLEVSGGECVEDAESGRVLCTQPAVTLTQTAGACNLPYTGPSGVQVWCALLHGEQDCF